VGGGDQAQIVHPGGLRGGRGGLGNGFGDVMSDHERGGHPGRSAFEVHLDVGEVLGLIAQLNPPAHQGRVDRIRIAF
jgi:hypothetical protein